MSSCLDDGLQRPRIRGVAGGLGGIKTMLDLDAGGSIVHIIWPGLAARAGSETTQL